MNQAIVFAFLSAIFAAATAILAKIGVKDINSNLATAIRTIVIVFFAWGIVLVQGSYKDLGHVSKYTWTFLILSGFATGLSWLFYFRALQIGEAKMVAPIDKFSLVLTIIFASLFLQEKITLATVTGVGLITIGTLVITLWK